MSKYTQKPQVEILNGLHKFASMVNKMKLRVTAAKGMIDKSHNSFSCSIFSKKSGIAPEILQLLNIL